jgi:hypothetical protein
MLLYENPSQRKPDALLALFPCHYPWQEIPARAEKCSFLPLSQTKSQPDNAFSGTPTKRGTAFPSFLTMADAGKNMPTN